MLTSRHQKTLLDLARDSIEYGMRNHDTMDIDHQQYEPELLVIQSCFVTLNMDGKLRGCIGGLKGTQPLVDDVVKFAFAAAFQDPRFPALTPLELPHVEIDISVLNPPEPISVSSEEALLKALRPKEDGLILQDQGHSATFLPSVWRTIPDAATFVKQLKLKAGLPENHWSSSMKCFRYTTQEFSE